MLRVIATVAAVAAAVASGASATALAAAVTNLGGFGLRVGRRCNVRSVRPHVDHVTRTRDDIDPMRDRSRSTWARGYDLWGVDIAEYQ